MLLHPLALLPLAFCLVQATNQDPELKCHYTFGASQRTLQNGPQELMADFGLDSDKLASTHEVLATFDELNEKDIISVLSKSGLVEELEQKFGKFFTFDLRSRCFAEPGDTLITVRTIDAAVDASMTLDGFDVSKHAGLKARYPDTDADHVWDIVIQWNHNFDFENFKVGMYPNKVNPTVPFKVPFPDNGFTIRPSNPDSMTFDWESAKNWLVNKSNIDSEYYCAIEVNEETRLHLWSWGKDWPVFPFRETKDQLGDSVWQAIEESYGPPNLDDGKRRYYVQKDKVGTYFLNLFTYNGTAHFFGLSSV